MCGILGSVNMPISGDVLNMISHRGPDGTGLEQYNSGYHDVFFGHKRLSIVDLSENGKQPMQSANGTSSIIFNGEIYNHEKLREGLSNISFKGTSDTETIINYISQNGIEAIQDFNGIFSIAYLDQTNHHLYIARDPFGVKPLYIYKGSDRCLFSSELKPLLKLKGPISLDTEALTETLTLRFAPAPLTFVKDVEKVVPGTIVKIDLSQKTLTYETIKFSKPIPNEINIPFEEALSQYEYHFEKAIQRQLMSDVELGILLSGGVDSALVAYYAQKNYNKKIKAFTIGFQGNSSANEIEDAQETARVLGLDHYYESINFNSFLDTVERSVKIVEEPIATTSTIPMLFLSEMVSKHVSVVLTGQGADEPLAGYNRYQLELVRNRIPEFGHNIISKVFSKSKNETLRRGAFSINNKDLVERLVAGYTLFNPNQIQRLTGLNNNSTLNHIKNTLDFLSIPETKSDLEKQLSLDLRFNLSDDLLLYTDKITMNYSIEARVPILDLELISFIESLPLAHKIKLKNGKWIHKKFAEKVLPKSIVYRKKKGFLSPTNDWFKTYDQKILSILSDKNSTFSNYFDVKEVENLFKEHKQGYNNEKQIFLLLNIFYWMENYLK